MPDAAEPLHYTPFAILVCVATTDARTVPPWTFDDAAAMRLTELVTARFGEEILDCPFAGNERDTFCMPLRVGPGKTAVEQPGKEDGRERIGRMPGPSTRSDWVCCIAPHPSQVSVTDPRVKVIT